MLQALSNFGIFMRYSAKKVHECVTDKQAESNMSPQFFQSCRDNNILLAGQAAFLTISEG